MLPVGSSRRRAGMTMIELVAALALFVVILGALLTIMNTATSLWSTARSQQREQTVGRHILDLLTDDLQHAVTDSVASSNGVSSPPPATFILDSLTNHTPDDVQIVLQFARHAKRHTQSTSTSVTPLSLDAVFYTYFKYALFRHAFPLSYTSLANPEPLGDLLKAKRSAVNKPLLHTQILDYMRDPASPLPSSAGTYTLLAERIDLLNLPAAIPEVYARKPPGSQKLNTAPLPSTVLPQTPQYDYLETDVLPDRIDVALRLHSAEDWATLDRLKNDTSDEADNTRKLLGVFLSKQITFPAQGGSRLP